MKFLKRWTRSKPANTDPALPESELCGMMREAIDATAAGSSPWHLKETREIIDAAPLTLDERKALHDYTSHVIAEVQRDILKRKLTEVLTGATVLRPSTILSDVKRMGEPHEEPMKNKTNPALNTTTARTLMEAHAKFMEAERRQRERNGYAAQQSSMQQMQNAQSAFDVSYEKWNV